MLSDVMKSSNLEFNSHNDVINDSASSCTPYTHTL